MPKLDTTPTIRYHNGKRISFYSPQQIELTIPVEKRQPAQRGEYGEFHTTSLLHRKAPPSIK